MARIFKVGGALYTEAHTNVPGTMHSHCKKLAFEMGKPISDLHKDAVTRFLKEKPYLHGLCWSRPENISASLDANGVKQKEWEPINARISLALSDELNRVVAEQNQQPINFADGLRNQVKLSRRAALYTIINWYTSFIYPSSDADIQKREAEKAQPDNGYPVASVDHARQDAPHAPQIEAERDNVIGPDATDPVKTDKRDATDDARVLDDILLSMPAIRAFNERLGQQWKSDAKRIEAISSVCQRQFGMDISRFLSN